MNNQNRDTNELIRKMPGEDAVEKDYAPDYDPWREVDKDNSGVKVKVCATSTSVVQMIQDFEIADNRQSKITAPNGDEIILFFDESGMY